MKLLQWILLTGSLLAAVSAQADDKNTTGPVDTVRKKEPCVIRLDGIVDPRRTKGHCELALGDPPAKAVFKGWYQLRMDTFETVEERRVGERVVELDEVLGSRADIEMAWKDIQGEASRVGEIFLDELAKKFIEVESKGGDGVSFPLWHAQTLARIELDPAPGKTEEWKIPVVYYKNELGLARKSLMEWAHRWKGYRGDAFANHGSVRPHQPKTFKQEPMFPKPHRLLVTAHRARGREATGSNLDQGAKEFTIGGGSEKRGQPTPSSGPLSNPEQDAGCNFSKPRITGMGKAGLAGLPKDFPLPPGIDHPWKYEVARGSLYALGVSGSWADTVRFSRKALAAHGWQITKETKTHETDSNTEWVHLFFSNQDYCGWVSTGTAVPHAPTPTSMTIVIKRRIGTSSDE